jgi:hypothetical protein
LLLGIYGSEDDSTYFHDFTGSGTNNTELFSILTNFTMEYGDIDHFNNYRININLLLNFTEHLPRVGDNLIILLSTCWENDYFKNLFSYRNQIIPTVELVGNASFSFSEDLDMNSDDFHYVSNFLDSEQSHYIYAPIEKIPTVWNISLTADLNYDFITISSPIRATRFCSAKVALDQGRIYMHPNVSFPMINSDFEDSYDSTTERYNIKFSLNRDLHESDRIMIWLLIPRYAYLMKNSSMEFDFFDQDSLTENISEYGNCIYKGEISSLPGSSTNELSVYIRNFRQIHGLLLLERNENFIWNAKVYLISSSFLNPNSTHSDDRYHFWLVIGISASIFVCIGLSLFLYKRYYMSKSIQKEIRYSLASTIIADDDSYTMHSESTISTVPSLLTQS